MNYNEEQSERCEKIGLGGSTQEWKLEVKLRSSVIRFSSFFARIVWLLYRLPFYTLVYCADPDS